MLIRSVITIIILFVVSSNYYSQNLIKPFKKRLAGVNVSFNCYGKAKCSFSDGDITTNDEKMTLATNLGELSYMYNNKDFQKYTITVKDNFFFINYSVPESGYCCPGEVFISGRISENGQKITEFKASFKAKDKGSYYKFRSYMIDVPEIGNFNKYSYEYTDNNFKIKHPIFSAAKYREETGSPITTCEFIIPENEESNNMITVILVFK